jgi:hypothetical protein
MLPQSRLSTAEGLPFRDGPRVIRADVAASGPTAAGGAGPAARLVSTAAGAENPSQARPTARSARVAGRDLL